MQHFRSSTRGIYDPLYTDPRAPVTKSPLAHDSRVNYSRAVMDAVIALSQPPPSAPCPSDPPAPGRSSPRLRPVDPAHAGELHAAALCVALTNALGAPWSVSIADWLHEMRRTDGLPWTACLERLQARLAAAPADLHPTTSTAPAIPRFTHNRRG
jgi:hypothetical protein